MYANKETTELAIAKGYKHCTCNGGYPDCICDGSLYSPVRLDDLQRWLRDEHNLHSFADTCNNNNEWQATVISVVLSDESNIHYEPSDVFSTYEKAVELAVYSALTLI